MVPLTTALAPELLLPGVRAVGSAEDRHPFATNPFCCSGAHGTVAVAPGSGGLLGPSWGGTHSTPVCRCRGQSCRSCITIKMQLALPGKCGAASVPTDSFTCLEVESVQYLAGSAELINLFNNDA